MAGASDRYTAETGRTKLLLIALFAAALGAGAAWQLLRFVPF